MPERVQVRKTESTSAESEAAEAPAVQDTTERAAHLAELDAMLDEIDDVLEENAEEFVAAYVQKGGE